MGCLFVGVFCGFVGYAVYFAVLVWLFAEFFDMLLAKLLFFMFCIKDGLEF